MTHWKLAIILGASTPATLPASKADPGIEEFARLARGDRRAERRDEKKGAGECRPLCPPFKRRCEL
jgi:hypothetical protein